MVMELREFNDKKKKKRKTKQHFQFRQKVVIFGIQISFNMICTVKSLKVKLT